MWFKKKITLYKLIAQVQLPGSRIDYKKVSFDKGHICFICKVMFLNLEGMKIVSLWVFLLVSKEFYSQNLVPNPSFENYRNCPTDISQTAEIDYWMSPTIATPDFFCACERVVKEKDFKVDVPDNFFGTQQARSGKAYAGFISHQKNQNIDYREYLSVALTAPLEKGLLYEVSFYISLADNSNFGINGVNALFTKEIPELTRDLVIEAYPGVLDNLKIEDDMNNWVKLTGIWEGKGYESFLTIGNFLFDSQLKTGAVKPSGVPLSQVAYYYLDDVNVSPLEPERNAEPDVERTMLIPNKNVVLKNIYFETGKWDLLPASFPELDNLAEGLRVNDDYVLEIYGHTDNVGDAESNLLLSKNRAAAVADYLNLKGVERYRLTSAGFGEKSPIDTNDTDSGRQNNRRVEVKMRLAD